MHKSSNRSARVSQQIQRVLAELVDQHIKDPRMPSLVTIAAVKISSDLEHARVYITAIGDENAVSNALSTLNHAAGFLRTELARRIKLRLVPQLKFVHDESLEYGNRMSKLIDTALQEDSVMQQKDTDN